MPGFQFRDLMIKLVAEGNELRSGPCLVSLCPGVTLPNCGPTNVCLGPSLLGCGATFCPNVSGCFAVTLLAGCDAGACSLKPCSDGGCSFKCSEGCTAVASLKREAIDELSDLAILRDQLTRALRQIDVDEARLRDDLRPRTAVEARELADKLSAAAEELRQQYDESPSGEEQ
jgi:hypothetical protein